MNTQFIQNGYLGYPVNYNTYPNHYDHFYRRHDRQAGQVSITAGTNGTLITNGQSTTESLTFPPGTPVAAHANIPIGYTFSHWETNVPGIQFMPSAQSEDVTFMMPDQPMTITAVLTPIFHLGEAVKVNPTAQTWATGEIIPTWVHGLEDSIREMRNNGTELLLDALNSWIRASDVIKVTQEAKPTLSTSSVPTESTSPTLTPIGLGDQVKVNQSVQTWATGEGMPAWVYGRVYPVIEM
ncbi:MAG: hypothetical protein FWG67_00575, partial [Defluviitaleaceae bacterium]|nr:hypothetical protein [Defluviitaleaceae bacterium]